MSAGLWSDTRFCIRKMFIRKCGSNRRNLKKMLRNHKAQFPKLSVSIGQKSVFRRYCIQNFKDGIQIHVYNINNESVNNFSQLISAEVKKNLRKSQAQFREKLRNLRLRQNDAFLVKKRGLGSHFHNARKPNIILNTCSSRL